MEPRPWSEDGATEIEKALLRAGRAEGPSRGADLRILAGLQASPAPTVKPAILTRWLKLGFVAVVAGGAAVVAYQLSRPQGVPGPVTPASSAVPETVVAPVAAPAEGHGSGDAPVPSEVSEGSEPAREEGAPSIDERRAVASGRIRKPPYQPNASPLDHSLGDETKALDRVREALDARQPSEAMRLLDGYRRKFPRGRLRPEATILRLAALLAAERHQAADSLAGQLLSDPAYAAYVPRIQSLLRGAKE